MCWLYLTAWNYLCCVQFWSIMKPAFSQHELVHHHISESSMLQLVVLLHRHHCALELSSISVVLAALSYKCQRNAHPGIAITVQVIRCQDTEDWMISIQAGCMMQTRNCLELAINFPSSQWSTVQKIFKMNRNCYWHIDKHFKITSSNTALTWRSFSICSTSSASLSLSRPDLKI